MNHDSVGIEADDGHINFSGDLNQILVAPDTGESDRFSSSIAVEKNVAVVGAPGVKNHDDFPAGAAYIFRKHGDLWQYEDTLVPDDDENFGSFGIEVAISKNVIAVSDFSANLVYVFEEKNNSWSLAATIEPKDEDPRDNFGSSLAIDGKFLAVGDPDFREAGTVYLYEPWELSDVVSASNRSIADSFGSSVSLSGPTLLTSSVRLNSAYIFERKGKIWQETEILLPDDHAPTTFGASVSLSGKTAVIGNPQDNEIATSAGAAYIFEKNQNSWTQIRKLTDPEGEEADHFGQSVAIDKGLIVIGAPGLDSEEANSSAYFVEKQGNEWCDLLALESDDVLPGDRFGYSVDVSEKTILAGAPGDDQHGDDSGKVYVY
ncbi:MAG: FG-GAP repeat protein [Balneolaceae bacterium]